MTDWHRLHHDAFRGDRVLVTGGAGFIGSHLAEVLAGLGASVVILDDLSAGLRENVDAAAKAGIIGLTWSTANALAKYGVTVNALAPAARTRMTEAAFAETMARPDSGFDAMDPANVSPVVAWLASEDSADVTGRVIEVEGGRICVEEGWRHGPARMPARLTPSACCIASAWWRAV